MGEKRTPDDPRKAKTRNQQDKALWIDPVFCQDRSGVSWIDPLVFQNGQERLDCSGQKAWIDPVGAGSIH